MELFLSVKNFKSPKQVMKFFFGIKNVSTVMALFSELKFLRVVRQWWSPLSVLKALRAVNGHSSLSFHMMTKFPGTTFYLSVPTEFL